MGDRSWTHGEDTELQAHRLQLGRESLGESKKKGGGVLKRLAWCLIALLAIVSQGTSRDRVFYFAFQTGIALTDYSRSTHRGYGPGLTLGAGGALDVNPNARLLLQLTYRRFPFSADRWPLEPGISIHEYEGSLGLRVALATSSVRPFLGIEGGVVHREDYGGIFDDSGVQAVVGLNSGLEWSLSDFVEVSASAGFSTSFDVEVIIPLTLKLYFGL